MAEKKITSYVRVGPGGVGEVTPLMPSGVPPVLRRFWNFTRDMARRFSKHLLKDRTEEFTRAILKDFERKI